MIIEDLIKKILKEATGDSTGSRGSYAPPLQPGIRDFDKSKLAPFTDPLTNYKSPLVAYDSYDHDWDLTQNKRQSLEKTAKKISNFIKKHPDATNSDEDGNVLNRTPSGKENSKKLEIVPVKHKKNKSKINEITTTTTAGEYSGPQELGLRKWKKSELGAFDIESDSPANNVFKKRTTKKNVYKVVGGWEPQQGKFEVPTYDVDGEHESQLSKGQLTNDPIEWYRPLKRKPVTKKDILKRQKMNEDLAVWFGEKKKPKGSSQPKGPWVDICRKVDGKHPPCGRSDASEGSYPKCRAAGVAGKMSDSEKRNACSQKRKAEKNDPQSGKGQKPVMVSHKKKTNENMKKRIITLTEDDLTRIVKRVLNEGDTPIIIKNGQKISLSCKEVNTKEILEIINGDVVPGQTTNAKGGQRVKTEDPTLPPGSGKYVEFVKDSDEFIHKFMVKTKPNTPGIPASPFDVKTYDIYIEPVSKALADSYSEFGITEGQHILTHMNSGYLEYTDEAGVTEGFDRYFCQVLSVSSEFGTSLENEGVVI